MWYLVILTNFSLHEVFVIFLFNEIFVIYELETVYIRHTLNCSEDQYNKFVEKIV